MVFTFGLLVLLCWGGWGKPAGSFCFFSHPKPKNRRCRCYENRMSAFVRKDHKRFECFFFYFSCLFLFLSLSFSYSLPSSHPPPTSQFLSALSTRPGEEQKRWRWRRRSCTQRWPTSTGEKAPLYSLSPSSPKDSRLISRE